MSDTAVVLARAIRLLEREARLEPGASRHSSPQDLNAYRSGELSPDQERRLQWHLALCFRCADRLLDMERFLEPPAVPANGEALDETASWRDLQDRLAQESRARRRPPPVFLALAALVPVVAGLLLWNLSLRGELLQPRANVPIQNVEMPGTLRDAARPAEIHLPAAGPLILVLTSQIPDPFAVRLEILEPSGHRIASIPGLKRLESGAFHVQLPRDLLPPGEYRLLLIGEGDDGTESREEIALRVLAL